MSAKAGRKRGGLQGESPEVRELAGVLRDISDSHGRTLRELADRMPFSRTTISEKLSGGIVPDWEFVAQFLKACAAGDQHAAAVLQDRLRPLWEAASSARARHRTSAQPAVAQMPADVGRWVTAMRETAAAQQVVSKLQLSTSRNMALTQGLTEMVGTRLTP